LVLVGSDQVEHASPPIADPADHRFDGATEDFQKELVRGGFAAVGFVCALTGHRYHDRPMKQWFLSETAGVPGHDSPRPAQTVLNYLENRGDLDMSRVGMSGEGSGASIATLASAVEARIKVLDVLDPWGDWPTWMSTSPFVPDDERPDYMKPEFLKKAATMRRSIGWQRLRRRDFGCSRTCSRLIRRSR
jgi:hypothetical protein